MTLTSEVTITCDGCGRQERYTWRRGDRHIIPEDWWTVEHRANEGTLIALHLCPYCIPSDAVERVTRNYGP